MEAKRGAGQPCGLPPKAIELCSMTGRWARSHTSGANLRGFAGAFGFDLLLRAHVYLVLLGFGFGFLRQTDLQHALVVVRRNGLGADRRGRRERTADLSALTL